MSVIRNGLRAFRATRIPRVVARGFSASASALKKRRVETTVASTFEDSFSASNEDDLFPFKVTPQGSPASSSSPPSPKVPAAQKAKPFRALFDEQYAFVSDRLGPNPRLNHPQVRDNALRRLLHYTTKGTQLDRMPELLEAWRRDGRQVDSQTASEFIDRCLSYHPAVIVEVLSNRPRYGVDIPDIAEARRILHHLLFKFPHSSPTAPEARRKHALRQALKQGVTFAVLYEQYGLPPATADLTSCALLAHACTRIEPGEKRKHERKHEIKSGLLGMAVSLIENLQMQNNQQPRPVGIDADRLGKGDNEESILRRRKGGFTQSVAVEWKWVNDGLQDLSDALKKIQLDSAREFSEILNRYLALRSGQ